LRQDTERDATKQPNQAPALEKKPCNPGEQWQSRCNHCRCNKVGEAVCTRKDCSVNSSKPIGAQ
jgi:hypothetical protein